MSLYGAAKAPNVKKSGTGTTVGKLTDNSGGTAGTGLDPAPAGGTGAAAGGWDTAANRDLAIAAINDNFASINKKLNDLLDHLNDR